MPRKGEDNAIHRSCLYYQFAILPYFTGETLATLLVTMATVLTILLKPFLLHPLNPTHAYWPKHG